MPGVRVCVCVFLSLSLCLSTVLLACVHGSKVYENDQSECIKYLQPKYVYALLAERASEGSELSSSSCCCPVEAYIFKNCSGSPRCMHVCVCVIELTRFSYSGRAARFISLVISLIGLHSIQVRVGAGEGMCVCV